MKVSFKDVREMLREITKQQVMTETGLLLSKCQKDELGVKILEFKLKQLNDQVEFLERLLAGDKNV